MLYLRRVLVRVNPEIAKVTALPAKGNVMINSQFRVVVVGLLKCLLNVLLIIRRPEGEGRIIGYEIKQYSQAVLLGNVPFY